MLKAVRIPIFVFIAAALLPFLYAAIGGPPAGQAQQKQPVDLELVLAIDSSTSVDATEFILQRRGLSEAFSHPDVIAAIRGAGELGIAVTLVQWSAGKRQRTVVDWMLVRDRLSARRLSAKIENVQREVAGMTDIAGAIQFSVSMLDDNQYEGYRQVIDISGDGPSDAAASGLERDRAILRGITINGLVIYNETYDPDEPAQLDLYSHYANHVIGGSGAFVMRAVDFVDFQVAIRKKLVREITGPEFASLNGG